MNHLSELSLRKIAVIIFGKTADKYSSNFENLKKKLSESNIKILSRTYVSMIFFATLVSYFVALPLVFLIGFFDPIYSMFSPVISLGVAGVVFVLMYYYPHQKAFSRKRDLDMNLPFAVNHMSAIATSGVPPKIVFKLLAGFREYGEISNEASKIIRNVEVFGQDITTSIKNVADNVPSKDFRELLYGMLSTIKTGGNLESYLRVKAKEALFIYRIRREEHLQALSTYADFYTAVMIAAPLFLVSILAIMNVVGGTIEGMTIDDIMNLGIYLVIPATNIAFIMFIHFTQPQNM